MNTSKFFEELSCYQFCFVNIYITFLYISQDDYFRKRENVVYSNQYVTLLGGSPRFSYGTCRLSKN